MEPVDTSEVPPPIAVVRDFVNTTDHETATDDLTTPAELTRYLVAHGLMPRASRATAEDLDVAAAAPYVAATRPAAEPRR